MQSFDIAIPINTTRNIDAQGDYLSYYAGSAGGADATLLLSHDSSGSTIQLKPGQAIRLKKGQSGGLWRLSNYANQGTIIGSVVIGAGQIDDHTITGSVQVIDNGKSRTLGGTTFSGAINTPAVAANISHGQIWNPPGSGKNIVIEKFAFASGTAQAIRWGFATGTATTSAGAMTSKKSGAAASSAIQYYGSSAALLPGFAYLGQLSVAAAAAIIYECREPYVLTPGFGFTFSTALVNTDMNITCEWFEEPQ